MKLNKKRLGILISVLCFLILGIFCFCSFTPPNFPTTDGISFSSLSEIDVEHLLSIVNLQHEMGSFTSLFPVYCRMRSNGILELTCLQLGGVYTFSKDSTGYWNFSSTALKVVYYFTVNGFTTISTSPNGSDTGKLLFYRTSENSDLIVNPEFSFSNSQNGDDAISDCIVYWSDLYSLVVNHESAVSEAYDDGYHDGFDTGFNYGEQFGYQDGYSDGVGTGYMHGYLEGEYVGYETGYDAGYENGYENGYDSGYSDVEPETIIKVVEPVELDIPRMFNAIGAVPRQVLNGVDFEIFGIPILGVLLSILVLSISIFVIRKMK